MLALWLAAAWAQLELALCLRHPPSRCMTSRQLPPASGAAAHQHDVARALLTAVEGPNGAGWGRTGHTPSIKPRRRLGRCTRAACLPASVRVWAQLSPHHAPLCVVGLLAPLSRPGCRHHGRPGAVCQRAAGPWWPGEQLPAADAAQHRRVVDPPELSVAFRTQPARCKPSGCLPQRMPPPARTAFGGAPATGLTRWFWNGKTSGRCAASKTARPTR